ITTEQIMAFMANPATEATLKKLLNQLLMSGMPMPLDNQSTDFRRLQEELLKSTQGLQGFENRMNMGGRQFGDENRLSREQVDARERNYGIDLGKSEPKGQDRSNFFGGALERKESMPSGPESSWQQKGRWSQPGGLGSENIREMDDRRQDRMGERMEIREGSGGPRYDISADNRGNSTFQAPFDVTPNFTSGLQFPNAFNTGQDPMQSVMQTGVGSEQWPSVNDQNLQSYMYGMDTSASFIPSFTVEPPPPSQPRPSLSEKPSGCQTIFIGGLADTITEDIMRQLFLPCGAIESVRISLGKGGKKFSHLRFIDPASVDLAVGYSGYKLFIGNGEQRSGGRMHVDHAKSREDEKEYEKVLRAREREARHVKDENEKPLVLYTEGTAADLMQNIRSSSGFHDSLETLEQWLERGECTRRSSSTFYNLLSAVHSHIKRLVKEKMEHEEIVERQKHEQTERAKLIMAQGAGILNIFKAASKKRCWDHFSKAQRRNIDEWHQQVEKEIKISEEQQMENRQEVGMDLDDELDHTQSTSETSQPEDEETGEPKAKQPKTQDFEECTQASLEAQDIKFRAQNAGLKALARKNASLMWEVEGYKNEMVTLKERFANVFQDKDLQIARLMTAVQGLQNFFQHVTLNTPEVTLLFVTNTSNIEVEVVKESTEYRETDTAEHDTVDQTSELNNLETKSSETDAEEQPEKAEEQPEKAEEQPEKAEEQPEKASQKKAEEQPEKAEEQPEKASQKKAEEQPEKAEEQPEKASQKKAEELPEKASQKKAKRGRKRKEGNTDQEVTEESETSETNVEKQPEKASQKKAKRGRKKKEVKTDQEVTEESEVSEQVTVAEAVATGDEENQVEAMTTMTEGETKAEDEHGESVSPHSTRHTDVVRLTSKEMSVVGLLCSYLQVCPYGATTEQVLVHIQRQVPGVTSEDLAKLLDSLPMIFVGDGLEFCNKTWKFKQLSK
ncbi:hypothetical protein QZH41_013312, partial [Actinostola sp. cb2023]